MSVTRRDFLRMGAVAGTTAALTGQAAASDAKKAESAAPNHVGCLVDTTLCIGCRQCESACNQRNRLPNPELPFTDRSVFRAERRPSENAFTVVNEYAGIPSADQAQTKQTYAKFQCMHCMIPSCVSACIVGALTKSADGSVVYNSTICMGCRYCLVACPFEVPTYEYFEPLTPRVRKCEYCTDRNNKTGADPSCAKACPTEALIFGKRNDLLVLAHDRIAKKPDRYLAHVYGENELGGTSWMYLAGRPFTEVGLLNMPNEAPAQVTESIQHGIFKYGIIPIALYGTLGAIMWWNHRREHGGDGEHEGVGEHSAPPPDKKTEHTEKRP